MNFFNEFNNLQKEIFKNIFGNGQKNPEQPKNELKKAKSPKVELKSPKAPKISKPKSSVQQNVTKNISILQNTAHNNNINGVKIETANPTAQIITNNCNGANLLGNQVIQPQKIVFVPNFVQNISNQSINDGEKFSIGNFGGESSSRFNFGLPQTQNVQKYENFYQNSQATTHNLKNMDQKNNNQVQCNENYKTPKIQDQKDAKSSPNANKKRKIKLPKRTKRSSPKEVDENSNYKPAAKKLKENASSKKKVNIYETPRKSFLVPQAQESANKGLRRGRSKFKKTYVKPKLEHPVKSFTEMSQVEFLDYLLLKKNDENIE